MVIADSEGYNMSIKGGTAAHTFKPYIINHSIEKHTL